MPTLSGKVIRIACNQDVPGPTVDALSDANLVLPQGVQARIQCALFTSEPAADTFIDDISNIVSVELVLRKSSAMGVVLVNQTVLADDIDASDYVSWLDLSGQQFEFVLDATDTSWAVLSSGVLPVYFSIKVNNTSTAYVGAFGYGLLQDVGLLDVPDPAVPNTSNVILEDNLLKVWNSEQQIYQTISISGTPGNESLQISES